MIHKVHLYEVTRKCTTTGKTWADLYPICHLLVMMRVISWNEMEDIWRDM